MNFSASGLRASIHSSLILAGAALLGSCEQDYQVVATPVDVNPEEVTDCGFTRVEDTPFWAYDCNPVFSTTGEGWADTIGATAFLVTEVMGHPFYQLWYNGEADEEVDWPEYATGYAVSADGTSWTPHTDNPVLERPDRKEWDHDSMDALQAVWDPATKQYVMIYQGINDTSGGYGLGVATSPDGRAWTRYAKNPVYDLHEPVGDVSNWCWPLGLSLGDVTGYTGYMAGVEGRAGQACEAYRLNASNVGNWSPSEKKFFAAGDAGAWDDMGFLSLSVATLNGKKYLFYSGFGHWVVDGNWQRADQAFLGWAKQDGDDWKREPDPIPVNNTEEGDVSAVKAVTVGTRIHLWVTDDYEGQSAVGYFLFDPERAEAEDAEAEE